jgi:Family of unknown function (DUF6529)
MSQSMGLDKKSPQNPAWLALPFVIFAVVSLTVGVLASRTVQQPYGTPYFQLFFSDTLHMKVWLASAALVLGFFQLLTASRIYGLLHFPPPGRFYNIVHRFSGWTAVILTLPVAYHCIFLLGFGGTQPCGVGSTCVSIFGSRVYDLRILVHSLLGSTIYGTFLAKVLLVRSSRSNRYPGWALPVAGGVMFATLLGLWLTSAYWFFGVFGIGL